MKGHLMITGAVAALLTIGGALGLDAPHRATKNRATKAVQPARTETTVPIIEESKVLSLLAEQKDKVVVANFWATWCGPCREEFPELVKLYQKYRNQGLVVLAFSIDEKEALDQVKKFLEEQKVDFPAYVINIKDQEKFIDLIDKDWPGSIPATFIYDQKGKLTKRLIGAQELSQFEKEIRPVLAARGRS